MSLKRKASSDTGLRQTRDYDHPYHLNSRTRKRFRDNRPDEHTIYGKSNCLCQCAGHSNLTEPANTLRILYQAQKQPHPDILSGSIDDPIPSTESLLECDYVGECEVVDPRQQSLLKFFRPSATSTSTSAQTITRTIDCDMDTAMTPGTAGDPVTIPVEIDCDNTGYHGCSGSSTPSTTETMGMDGTPDTIYTPERTGLSGLSWT